MRSPPTAKGTSTLARTSTPAGSSVSCTKDSGHRRRARYRRRRSCASYSKPCQLPAPKDQTPSVHVGSWELGIGSLICPAFFPRYNSALWVNLNAGRPVQRESGGCAGIADADEAEHEATAIRADRSVPMPWSIACGHRVAVLNVRGVPTTAESLPGSKDPTESVT